MTDRCQVSHPWISKLIQKCGSTRINHKNMPYKCTCLFVFSHRIEMAVLLIGGHINGNPMSDSRIVHHVTVCWENTFSLFFSIISFRFSFFRLFFIFRFYLFYFLFLFSFLVFFSFLITLFSFIFSSWSQETTSNHKNSLIKPDHRL